MLGADEGTPRKEDEAMLQRQSGVNASVSG